MPLGTLTYRYYLLVYLLDLHSTAAEDALLGPVPPNPSHLIDRSVRIRVPCATKVAIEQNNKESCVGK